MTMIVRRTIEELLVRYELEPGLRDIYVEGSFDREVIIRCSDRCSDRIVTVYEIDSVDVPVSLLNEYGLTEGNKQRVIALSKVLSDIEANCLYRCLVDRDLDHWFGPLERIRGLVWTDHCAIELYFLTDELLRDIVIFAAKARIDNLAAFKASLIDALSLLYAVRLADRDLGWSMKWISCDKHLSAVDSRVEFDEREYIKRLLMANGRYLSKATFEESMQGWRNRFYGDPRSHIRGHDFVEVLGWAIRAFRGSREFASTTVIQGVFVMHAARVSELWELFTRESC
jgi:hypothetical protein